MDIRQLLFHEVGVEIDQRFLQKVRGLTGEIGAGDKVLEVKGVIFPGHLVLVSLFMILCSYNRLLNHFIRQRLRLIRERP